LAFEGAAPMVERKREITRIHRWACADKYVLIDLSESRSRFTARYKYFRSGPANFESSSLCERREEVGLGHTDRYG
jgi:hypothetical protein